MQYYVNARVYPTIYPEQAILFEDYLNVESCVSWYYSYNDDLMIIDENTNRSQSTVFYNKVF